MGLFPQHAHMLAASGITPEHALARGYVSVDIKKRLENLNVTKAGRNVPGLLVPQRGKDGNVWGWQYRPDKPRLSDAGKPVKYETPVGQRNGIDVPPGVGPLLDDPNVPLWITEGVKKADAAALAGLCCVALPGVWSWRGRNDSGGKVAVGDWHDIALNGREVVLAFDSDVMVKPAVRRALLELSKYLGTKGSRVSYCHLPDTGDGKTGLDDYLAAGHSVDELLALVRPDAPTSSTTSSTRPTRPAPTISSRPGPTLMSPPAGGWRDENLRSHQRMAARFASFAAGRVLYVHGAGWHHWDGTRWAPDANSAHTSDILAQLLRLSWSEAMTDRDLQADVRASSSGTGSRGVLDLASRHRDLFTEHVDADPWLLNCQNGTLDLHTLDLRPHNPADRITKVCAAAYRPEITAPTWTYLVNSSLPDEAVRGFLQRYAGLALVGRVIEHRLVILTGEGRNGKGMFAHTVGKALGSADGYAITGASSMLVAGRYGDKPSAGELAAQYRLRGARWVVMSEIQRGARMDEATMKMLTGGDKIQAKRMGGDPVDFAPSHSLAMLANDLPLVDPDAKAVWDRLRVVPFTVDFSGREDKTLEERLELELDGVLTWCVDGLRDYLARGRQLDEPAAVLQRTRNYRDANDSLGRFITDECVEHPAAHITKAEFAEAYAKWADDQGEKPLSPRMIATRMGKRPGITDKRTGAVTRAWVGIALKATGPGSENAATRESVTSVTSSRSSHIRARVKNHREEVTQVTQEQVGTEFPPAPESHPAEAEQHPSRQSEHQSEQLSRGESPTALTAPTGGQKPQSVQLVQSEHALGTPAPTGAPTGEHHLSGDDRSSAAAARCLVCGGPMDPWLVAQGERFHVGCDPTDQFAASAEEAS